MKNRIIERHCGLPMATRQGETNIYYECKRCNHIIKPWITYKGTTMTIEEEEFTYQLRVYIQKLKGHTINRKWLQ